MASTVKRRDPMPSFCFKVVFSGVGSESDAEAFFRSVSGLKYETEVLDVRAGGVNDSTFRLPGATKWNNITLKRGFSGSSGFMRWREEWLNGKCTRASGSIQQLDTQLNVITTWSFEEAWPVKWEISDFDATKSELSIETLELAHHGLKVGG
jgi:phage tail-like protein